MYYKKNYNKKNANKLFFSYLIAYVEFFMARLYGFLFLFLFMNDYMGLWWLMCLWWMSLEATMWLGCDSFEKREEERGGNQNN